jgi:hypothetical protein
MASGRATWVKADQRMTGHWEYQWSSDRFLIVLDERDPITGQERRFTTGNDVPEWGDWKRESKD